MTERRLNLLNELVNEVTRDDTNLDKVKEMMDQLGMKFTDDPMQLLNNVLKGIHFEGPNDENKDQNEAK